MHDWDDIADRQARARRALLTWLGDDIELGRSDLRLLRDLRELAAADRHGNRAPAETDTDTPFGLAYGVRSA